MRCTAVFLTCACWAAAPACAIDVEWDGSVSNNFHVANNWTPSGVPGASDDVTILGASGEVYLSNTAHIDSLYLNGSSLRTNGQVFEVDHQLQIVAGSTVTLEGGRIEANVLDHYNGHLYMEGGTLLAREQLIVNDFLQGHGTIQLDGSDEVWVGYGAIQPDALDITIEATGGGTIDFDGVINVSATGATLTIDAPWRSFESFDGTLILGEGNSIDLVQGWTLGEDSRCEFYGLVTAPTLAGGLAEIDGEIDVFGDAVFAAPIEFTSECDVRVEVGELELEGATTYAGGTFYGTGEISQNAPATVASYTTIEVPVFDLDGDDGLTQWLIERPLVLDVTTLDETTDTFNGTLQIEGAGLEVHVADGEWMMDGTLHFTSAVPGAVQGDEVRISGGVDVDDGLHRLVADTVFTNSANVQIEAGARLELMQVEYRGGSYSGNGSLVHSGDVLVNVSTTINVDHVEVGSSATPSTETLTIRNGAELSLLVDTLGVTNHELAADVALEGGALRVDNLADFWTVDAARTVYFRDVAGAPNQVLGDGMNVRGRLAVEAGIANRVEVLTYFQPESTVEVASGARLRLLGDTIYRGGTLTGAGEVQQDGPATVDGPLATNGPVTIATSLFDMDGPTESTPWSIQGAASLVIDVGQLDDGGNRFDGSLALANGALTVRTSADRWRLSGLATSAGLSVIAGETVEFEDSLSVAGGSLTVQAPSEVLGAASLNVAGGALLNLAGGAVYRGGALAGAGALVQGGSVTVATNTAINTATYDWDGLAVNGSSTTINAGATLTLNAAVLDTDGGHDGLISLADAARLEVNVVPSWNVRTGTLRLNGPDAVVAGAANLRVAHPAGRIEGIGQVLVDVDNAGVLSPGLSSGSLTLAGDYVQQATGTLVVELGGQAWSAYDHLHVEGTASLQGVLDIDLIGGFIPGEGDVFHVLAYGAVTGAFSELLDAEFGTIDGDFLTPLYRADHLVLYRPLPGDANFDGLVSGADYTIWADNFGAGNNWTQADFTGDDQVTGADYTIWADNFGRAVSFDAPPPAAVPEPAGWMLALAASGLLVGYGARRARERVRRSSQRASAGRPAF